MRLLTLLFHAGFALGALIAYPINHKFGYLPTLKSGILFSILGMIIVLLSNSFEVFLFGKFTIGLSIGMTTVMAQVYAIEIVHPQFRSVALGLINAGWYIGSILSNLFCYSKYSLKHVFFVRIEN
jgi:predicted MFS family arabinose efflux permease